MDETRIIQKPIDSSLRRGLTGRCRWSLMALLALAAAAIGLPPVADGHPISRQQHDRTVWLRVGRNRIAIDYTLALDQWTLLQDLLPFSRDIDFAGDPRQLYREFANRYGPRMAEGIAAELDGQPLRFKYEGYRLQIEDHLRYTFTLRAGIVAKESGSRRVLTVTDSNFALEPGLFRIAVTAEDDVEIVSSTAANDPEEAAAVALQQLDPVTSEETRTARVEFQVMLQAGEEERVPESAGVSRHAPSPPTTGGHGFDVTRLLDTRRGLAVLLFLAFFFGAAHALQPGHGKTLVAAYLVGEQGTIGHAFLLGLVTTLTHTSIVFLLAIVVPLVYPRAESEITFALSLGCGLLVTAMSIWLLLKRLAGQADHVHLFGGHHHGPRHKASAPDETAAGQRVTWWALIALGVTGGLVPCVDALALLTATWVLNRLWLGLPLILAFSAGLASVLVAIGIAVVKFKRFTGSRWGSGRFVTALPIVSALATLALGVWMCQAALRQYRGQSPAPASRVELGRPGFALACKLSPDRQRCCGYSPDAHR